MMTAYHAANALSITLFLYYGVLCLFADSMAEDFERFGLAPIRRLTGVLEILGAVGLALGYIVPLLAPLSAAGLGTLMVAAVWARVRAGDPAVEMVPAGFLFLVSGFIFVYSVPTAGIAP